MRVGSGGGFYIKAFHHPKTHHNNVLCLCSLQVVSTRVGGVPEVLPPDLITLAVPKLPGMWSNIDTLFKMVVILSFNVFLRQDLVSALEGAISHHRMGKGVSPHVMHERVREMYKWQDVAERTEKVTFLSLCVCAGDMADYSLHC